jgi:hypothetical protein
MADETRFRTTLRQAGRTATGIVVPPEVVIALGAGRRPPVRVTLTRADGAAHTYRSTVAARGEEFLVGVSAEVRAAAGVAGGDEVEVLLEHDTAPRVAEVPADLAAALAADAGARAFFAGLSYSHQRAYTLWVDEAKKPQTRARRVDQALQMLRDKRTRS